MPAVQLHDLVRNTANRNEELAALSFKNTTLCYGDLWCDIYAVASGFISDLEMKPQTRVGIYMDKRFETVTAMFATSAARGVFVPINPLLKPKQVSYIMNDCDVKILITTADRHNIIADELEKCEHLEYVVIVGGGPVKGDKPNYGVIYWDDLSLAWIEDFPFGGTDADMAAIFYTSGSTGKPKGVVLSHRNIIVGAESVSSYLENTEDDVIASVLPLSFDAGFSQLTTAFNVGAHVVLVNYLLPGDVVKACAKYGVTGLTAVPPLWLQLVDASWPKRVAENIRYFANTGGRMPKTTLDNIRSIFTEASPFLMYGLTEAFRSTYLDPSQVDSRPDSIGKAIPNAEILVVREDGTICDDNEPGELVHRGPLVSMGYWNNPEKTAERFKPTPGRDPGIVTSELAVWSGDTVTRDSEGYLYFIGRSDEMIKTSGYRTSPTEVEEMVLDTGTVSECVAFGEPDEKLGQSITIVVSPVTNSGIILEALRKTMPRYMVPTKVVMKDSLPRSANGKFDRNLIREGISQ